MQESPRLYHKPQEVCDEKSECTPSLLKEGQSNKRKKELLSIKEIKYEQQKFLERLSSKIISCNVSGQKKTKKCVIAMKETQPIPAKIRPIAHNVPCSALPKIFVPQLFSSCSLLYSFKIR